MSKYRKYSVDYMWYTTICIRGAISRGFQASIGISFKNLNIWLCIIYCTLRSSVPQPGLYYNLILQALELPPRMRGADMNTCKHWELQKHTNTYSKATSNSVEKRKLL